MALVHGYISLTDLKEVVGDDTNVDNARYEDAINAASRQIDKWLDPKGTRHFWTEETPTARLFHAFNRWLVLPGFFSTTVGLIVKTDDNGDGTFETTWTLGTDYQAQPGVRPNGEPYTNLVATGTKMFPLSGRRECIEATAKWGCTTIPELGRQAAQILSVALYKSKDFTGGDIGFNTLENSAGWSVYDLARSLIEDYQLNPTPRRAVS